MSTDAQKKKYDRQLRIWGTHGQAKLEGARICLLDAGPTGSETLKNLVLGGIAAFTIVDEHTVESADLGNNFLLNAASLGRSRGECVTQLLKELNPSVSGSFVDESPAKLLETRPEFFGDFQLVVAAQAGEQEAVKLDAVCRSTGTPLIVARSYGLVGYLRPSVAEHTIIESKPDYPEEDLRLAHAWPQLQEWAESFDLPALDDAAHAHVPYVAILIQAVAAWRAAHGPKLPSNAKQKAAFRELVRSWQHKVDGVLVESFVGSALEAKFYAAHNMQEENFSEALESRRLYRLFNPPGIPDEVRAILDDPAASGSSTEDFWILAAALREFVAHDSEGCLPLEGAVPDMTSTTASYLALQRIYRERADRDVAALEAHVRRLEAAPGRPERRVPAASIRFFAKHARLLRVVRYASLAEEAGGACAEAIRSALEKEDLRADAALYILLRAVDRFHATSNRLPGSFDSSIEEDIVQLKSVAASVVSELGAAAAAAAVPDDYVSEVVRFGGAEIHCVAAVIGGLAAQEAIKLLTGQFVPLAGTLVYNAMAGTSAVFRA